MILIGIDPGKAGAVAWSTPDGILVERMPATEHDIWSLIRDTVGDWAGDAFAYIERQQAMPKQGSTSGMTIGTGYGGLRMALVAAGIAFEAIESRAWQDTFGLLRKKKSETQAAKKKRHIARAQELFPQFAEGMSDGEADALLILEHGRRLRSIDG